MNSLDDSALSKRCSDRHAGRLIYWISDRPESYELWGEVKPQDTHRIAHLIAQRAAEKFPQFEFRIDGNWHVHEQGMETVSAYIEDHLPQWIEEATTAVKRPRRGEPFAPAGPSGRSPRA